MTRQRYRDATRFRKTYSFYRQEPRPESTVVHGAGPFQLQPAPVSGSIAFASLPTSYDTLGVTVWHNNSGYDVDLNEVYLSALQNSGEQPSGEYWTIGVGLLSAFPALVYAASASGSILNLRPTFMAPVTVPAGETLVFVRWPTGSPTLPSRLGLAGWARVPDGYVTNACVDDAGAEYGCVLYHNTGSAPARVEDIVFAPQRTASGSLSDYWVLRVALLSDISTTLASVTSQTGSLDGLQPVPVGAAVVPPGDTLFALRKSVGSPALALLPFWVQGRVSG